MKWLFVVAIIAGCLAHLDASRLLRRSNSGEATGGALNGFFANNGNSGGVDDAIQAAGGTFGGGGIGAGGNDGNDANDGGGDTPDGRDSPDNSPGAAAAGGGGNEVGDTPDGVDNDFDSGRGGYGYGGRPFVNTGQRNTVVDDTPEEQAADPGQIVGESSSAGTTAGIVVGVVALVGVAAGVAVYVVKKRN